MPLQFDARRVTHWCRSRLARVMAESGPRINPWQPLDELESRNLFSSTLGPDLPVNPVQPSLPVAGSGSDSAMNQKFVSQVYQDVLGRPADAGGLASWTSYLNSGHTFADVAEAIAGSREYDADVVDKVYVQYLGRHAEASGLTAWVDQMQAGLNAQVIRTGILGSDEFYNRPARTPAGSSDTDFGGGNGTDAGFVTVLYLDFLNRQPDATGLSAWETNLAGNPANRPGVATGISNSDENQTAIITGYYQAFFGRTPDAAGLGYWKEQLAKGIAQPCLITSFVTSSEYLNRNGITTAGVTVPLPAPTPTPTPTPSPTPTSPVSTGVAAPSWDLPDVQGNIIHSSDLVGKVVVVDFWATWCPPCDMEVPQLIALQNKYGVNNFAVVGIAVYETSEIDVQTFMLQNGINYQVVMGNSSVINAFGGIVGVPTAFVIDRTGNVANTIVGYSQDPSVLENAITPLL